MARFVLGVAVVGAGLWLLDGLVQVPGVLWLVFWLALAVSIIYYIARLIGFVRARLLWRLRRRLIVTYVFIAVIPILLILVLVAIGGLLINAQFAAFLVAQNVRERVDRLGQVGRVVTRNAYASEQQNPSALLDRVQRNFVTRIARRSADHPALEVTIRVGAATRTFDLTGAPLPRPVEIPGWLTGPEFSGIVIEGSRVLLRSVTQGDTAQGHFVLVLSEPVTPELLDLIGAGIGPVGVGVIAPPPRDNTEARAFPAADSYGPDGMPRETTIMSKSVPMPAPAFLGDYTVFGAFTLDPVVWGGTESRPPPPPVFLYVTSRLMTLEGRLLSTLGRFSRVYAVAFVAVGAVFLVLEFFAFWVGIRLTRSITITVDELYSATERVRAGDFSHRIRLPARDQLSALGESFDAMTESIERLLQESQEKSRLEGELEIAREVQSRLFPRTLPTVQGLDLWGRCQPARTVSGDYYDFIQVDSTRIALVLGDIAGKGISAALLMAAIQSSLRAQIVHSSELNARGPLEAMSTAEIVRRLNRQLVESTSVDRYATFFCGLYNGATRELTYTNAGHLPPVIFRRHSIERLKAGGTVLGIFPGAEFEEATVRLDPGDVVFAFTDGLTEPENNFEEEFGEARLIEIISQSRQYPLAQMAARAFDALGEWTGTPELHDDMTVIVARPTGPEQERLAST